MSTADTAAAAPPRAGQYVCCAEAARLLGTHPERVRLLAAAGLIRRRALPGARTLYSSEDLSRLLREAE